MVFRGGLCRGDVGELFGDGVDSGTFVDGALDAGSSAPPPEVGEKRELLNAAQLASPALEARESVLQDLGDRAQVAVRVGKPAVDAEPGGAEDAFLDQLGEGSTPGSASAASRARHCTSATRAAVCESDVCASSARTSTVPRRGWGRSFHQKYV